MKIKKILSISFALLLIPTAIMLFCNIAPKSPGGGSGSSNAAVEKDLALVIYNYTNLPKPSIRKTNTAYTCPAMPYIGQSTGATSLSDSPNTKFYCVVTVKDMTNTNWSGSSSGVKTFKWTSNSGNLNIKVPSNHQFKITVEYYEPCGPYWTDNTWGRGKWITEKTMNYASTVGLTQWTFVKKENCN